MTTALEIKAGPEMDAEIARLVFGWIYFDGFWTTDPKDDLSYSEGPPCYSTDIAAAWLVVEKMRERFRVSVSTTSDGGAVCTLWKFPAKQSLIKGRARADTAPLAICLAALAALEAKD